MGAPFNPLRVGEDLEEAPSGGAAFDPRKVGDDVDEKRAQAPEEKSWAEWLSNLGMGAADGLMLKNASLVPGSDLARKFLRNARDYGGLHEIDGQAPTYAGERDPDLESLYELANDTPEGKIGGAVGEATTGALAAAAAPATIPAQMLVGLGAGALTAGGDTDWKDAGAVTGGAVTGAGLGLLGAGVSKLGGLAKQSLSGPADDVASGAASQLDELLANLKPSFWKDKWYEYPEKVAKTLGLKALQAGAGEEIPKALGGGAAALSGMLAPEAHAQDRPQIDTKAYAGMPAVTWATKQTLSSGSGLSPQDTERLTRVIVSGDEDRLKAENFKLSQRYPEYAKRLQAALSSLNDEGINDASAHQNQ